MVKMVDKKISGRETKDRAQQNAVTPAYPVDHIGWSLWQGSQIWHEKFVREVRSLGYDWFTQSSSTLMGNLSRKGMTQKVLTARIGLSKQAVNQQIDELACAGILERRISEKDKRVRVVHYTALGAKALVDVDRVKMEIEADFAAILGPDDMALIKAAIDKLVAAEKSATKKPAKD